MGTITVRELILEQERGQDQLDKYLVGGYVLAIEVEPTEADTCVVGEAHAGDRHSRHLCLKKVSLEDQIDPNAQNVMVITEATWEKSLEQNLLKAKLDEFKAARSQGD